MTRQTFILPVACFFALTLSSLSQTIPQWWNDTGVYTNTATAETENHSAANLGQLMNLAQAVHDRLESVIPTSGGAGSNLSHLVTNEFLLVTNAHRVAMVTDLKYVGGIVYDRLIELDLAATYPWDPAYTNESRAAVNIGQVKYVFDFGLGTSSSDLDDDGMEDAWEITYFGGLTVSGAGVDSDGDGLSDLEEFLAGTNPLEADTDGDGLSDLLETQLGTDPLNPDTDGDGFADGLENRIGTDPLVETCSSPASAVGLNWTATIGN